MTTEARMSPENKKIAAERFIRQYIALEAIDDQKERGKLLAKLAKQTCIQLELPLRIEENTRQYCDRILRHIAAHYPDIMQNLNQSLHDSKDEQSRRIIAKTLDRVTENLNTRVQAILKFPATSRPWFFSFRQKAKETKWVKETAEKLRLLRRDMLSTINDEELLRKEKPIFTRYKQLDNEFIYLIQLDILKNCNSQSELISQIKRYLMLANECLASGDPISASHIHGALNAVEIFNLTEKGSVFRSFLQENLSRLQDDIKEKYAWAFTGASNNIYRMVDNFISENKEPIRAAVDDQELLITYTTILRLEKDPTLKDMKPDTIAVVLQDGQLTAFWIEDGKIQNKAFSEDVVPAIVKALPLPGDISKDEGLIQNIISQYGCDQRRKEKLANLIAHSSCKDEKDFSEKLGQCKKNKSSILNIFKEIIPKLYPRRSLEIPKQKPFVSNQNAKQEVEELFKKVSQKIKPPSKSKSRAPGPPKIH